jgi:hypothetical protein
MCFPDKNKYLEKSSETASLIGGAIVAQAKMTYFALFLSCLVAFLERPVTLWPGGVQRWSGRQAAGCLARYPTPPSPSPPFELIPNPFRTPYPLMSGLVQGIDNRDKVLMGDLGVLTVVSLIALLTGIGIHACSGSRFISTSKCNVPTRCGGRRIDLFVIFRYHSLGQLGRTED